MGFGAISWELQGLTVSCFGKYSVQYSGTSSRFISLFDVLAQKEK